VIWTWEGSPLKEGVFVGGTRENSFGYDTCSCGDSGCKMIRVRFDRYDYVLDKYPENCHTIPQCAIDHELTDEDVASAIASIQKVAGR
jgi:hypothetical protein